MIKSGLFVFEFLIKIILNVSGILKFSLHFLTRVTIDQTKSRTTTKGILAGNLICTAITIKRKSFINCITFYFCSGTKYLQNSLKKK